MVMDEFDSAKLRKKEISLQDILLKRDGFTFFRISICRGYIP